MHKLPVWMDHSSTYIANIQPATLSWMRNDPHARDRGAHRPVGFVLSRARDERWIAGSAEIDNDPETRILSRRQANSLIGVDFCRQSQYRKRRLSLQTIRSDDQSRTQHHADSVYLAQRLRSIAPASRPQVDARGSRVVYRTIPGAHRIYRPQCEGRAGAAVGGLVIRD